MFHKRHKLAEPNVPATWAEAGAWRGWEPPLIVVDPSAQAHDNYAVRWRGAEDGPTAGSTDRPQRDVLGIHTGGSSHGGRWTGIDQRDRLVTIKGARDFLRSETDPLERHFAYN